MRRARAPAPWLSRVVMCCVVLRCGSGVEQVCWRLSGSVSAAGGGGEQHSVRGAGGGDGREAE